MPLSVLPLGVLYGLSSCMYFVIFHVVRYRRRVVVENLKKSFPEKSDSEIEAIARKFFAHLCDLIFESIKGCAISEAEIRRRHRYTNIELLNAYYDKGKRVTILGAHYGNWEWVALSLPLVTKFQTYGIFQTLTNPFMDRTVKKSRQRHGMKLISTKEVARTLRDTQAKKTTMGYIGDQSPSRHGRHHWVRFLNQDTAASTGYEHFAKEYDAPVLYLNIVKTQRGYYEGTFLTVADEPRKTRDGEIIECFMSTLEQIIRKQPEYWLWSHRRWKLQKPVAAHQPRPNV
ncbi:MAG: lysophospholipid acyltransferase family protein [Deltaproteobacteria bacterium]|nr:lysophospholipid acyltransferase family protein [Deltaproteobacteria bacterium]